MTLHFFAALLIVSWVWPVTRAGWDAIDAVVFNIFNNSLRTGKNWQTFWAVTNWRFFDSIQFFLVFGIAFYWIFRQDKKSAKQRIVEYFFFILLCFAVNAVFKSALILFDCRRLSPTKIIEGAFRLSHAATWLATKDFSNDAFPGDHGFVLISASVFYWLKGGFRLGLTSSFLLAPFLLPRLVVGAHWATDILVGSVAMSLVTIGWYFGTPLKSEWPLWSWGKLENRFPVIGSYLDRNLTL